MLRLAFSPDGTNYKTSEGDVVNSTDGAYQFLAASSQGYTLPSGSYHQLQTFTIYHDFFYLNQVTHNFQGMINLDDGYATGVRIAYTTVANTRQLVCYIQVGTSNSPNFTGKLMFSPQSWNRLVLQKSGTTIRLWVNGVLDTTYTRATATIPWLGSGYVNLGRGATANYYANGLLKNVRMYSDYHTDQEIQDDYFKCKKITANRVFDYPMISDLNDISGNARHITTGTGTLVNSDSKIYGIIDRGEAINKRQVARFDGVNDYISFAAMTSGEFPDNSFSIRAAIRSGYITANSTILQCGVNNNGAFTIYKTTTSIQCNIGDTVSTSNTNATTFKMGQNAILDFTYDGATIRVYINGNLITTVASTRDFRTGLAAMRLGSRVANAEFHNGQIWNVGIYNTVRDATTILNDFNNGYPDLTGCIHYWPLNGDANDTIGSLHGTVNGATFETVDYAELDEAPTEQSLDISAVGATDSLRYRLEALNNV